MSRYGEMSIKASDYDALRREALAAVRRLGARPLLLEAALTVLLRHKLLDEFAAEVSKPPDEPPAPPAAQEKP